MKRINPNTKRKIAGIIAILLVVIMVLGAIAPLFTSMTYGAEPQQYTVEAQLGFDGAVKIEKNAPVFIRVTNNSGTVFKGKAAIFTKDIPTDSYYAPAPFDSYDEEVIIEYFSDIELAAGETKEIYGSIPISVIESTYNVQLVDSKGKTAAARPVSVVTSRDDEKWLGVMSDSIRTRDAITQVFSQYSNRYGFTHMTEVTPDTLEYLENIDMLVVNDYDMNSLNGAQLDNLKTWISSGGTLVLGTDSDITEQKWYRAVSDEGRESTEAMFDTEKKELKNMYSNYVVPAYVDSSDIVEMDEVAELLSEDYLVKLISIITYYGEKGDASTFYKELIYQLYDDELLEEVIDSECEKLSENEDFKQYTLSELVQPGYIHDVYSVDAGCIYTFEPDTLASGLLSASIKLNNASSVGKYSYFGLERPFDLLGGFFLGFIMLYAIFIGPILYVILKKKDKKESAVKIIPMSAAILAGVIVLCGIGSGFRRPMVSVINLVDASDGGIRAVKGTAVCSAPIKGELRISNDTLGNVHTESRRYERKSCRISLNSFDYTELNATKWDSNKFIYNDTIELNGGLEARITNIDNSNSNVTVTVTNNTGYDLEDICFCGDGYNAEYMAAKSLRNGESLTYTGNYRSDFGYHNRNSLSGDEMRRFNKLSPNKRRAAESSGSYIKVTGFTNNNFSGEFRMNGRKASKSEITAFYSYATNEDALGEFIY